MACEIWLELWILDILVSKIQTINISFLAWLKKLSEKKFIGNPRKVVPRLSFFTDKK